MSSSYCSVLFVLLIVTSLVTSVVKVLNLYLVTVIVIVQNLFEF